MGSEPALEVAPDLLGTRRGGVEVVVEVELQIEPELVRQIQPQGFAAARGLERPPIEPIEKVVEVDAVVLRVAEPLRPPVAGDAAALHAEASRRLEAYYDGISPWFIIGSSVAFEIVMLTFACFIFVRRDY